MVKKYLNKDLIFKISNKIFKKFIDLKLINIENK